MRRQLCFLPPCGANAQGMDVFGLRRAQPSRSSNLIGTAAPSLRLQHTQAAIDGALLVLSIDVPRSAPVFP